MAKEMVVNPGRCTGCSTCALTCAITYHDAFDLGRAFVSISRDDFGGRFVISFSSACRGCRQCAAVCPAGALRVVDLPDPPAPAGH